MTSPELARAEALIDLGRDREAETLLRTILAQEPESARALQMLALVLLRQQRYGDAVDAARSAVVVRPEGAYGYRLLSRALDGAERHGESVEAAREAVRLAPHSWESRVTLAIALTDHRVWGAKEEALSHALEATRLAPLESDTHVAAGLCHWRLRHGPEAVAAYREALRLDPQNASAMNNLAVIEMDRGQLRSASTRLTAGLSSAPQDELLRKNLDVALLKVIRRNYFLCLIGGLVLSGLSFNYEPTSTRIAVLVVIACALPLNLYLVMRHFPRGSLRWTARLAARVEGRAQYSLVLSVIAAGLVTALGVLDPVRAQQLASHVTGFFGVGLVAGIYWAINRSDHD